MAVKEQQRIEERVALPAVTGRLEAFLWAAATVVIAALAVVLVVFLMDSGTETAATADLRSDQQVLADLANQGYIPAGAVDFELLATEKLVNRGLVPEAGLRGYITPAAPIFTPEDIALMHAVRTGVIPMQAVNWDDVALKRLVNQGLVPRAALEPYSPPIVPARSPDSELSDKLVQHANQASLYADTELADKRIQQANQG